MIRNEICNVPLKTHAAQTAIKERIRAAQEKRAESKTLHTEAEEDAALSSYTAKILDACDTEEERLDVEDYFAG